MTIMRLAQIFAILLVVFTTDGLPALALTASAQTATPGPATPVADFASESPQAAASTTATAPEQELADKYVPIARLRTQPADCSSTGERYMPIAVDITLNNPEVMLRRRKKDGETSDPVIKEGPTAQDLVDSEPGYYLDLPGRSLDPGCVYEQWSRTRASELGLTPSVYAHIATEAGRPGKLALQYWFYYTFNEFNNNHESDWEMIQLTFDADTVEEALGEDPVMLSYAQHSGGENADWGDDNVLMEDGHLLTFPGQGSHADYYQDAVWLAWGENGSGFGCDQSQERLTEVRLHAIVVPQKIDPDGPFAWALYQGRWGEYHAWQFNGPLGPNTSERWMEPISWTDDLRLASYPLPQTTTFGVGPGQFFCSLSTMGGNLAKTIQVQPQLILAMVGVVIAALLLVTILTWRFLGGAIRLYARNVPTFLLSSVILLAVAAFTTWLQRFIHHTVLAKWIDLDADQETAFTTFLDNGGTGVLLQFMLAGLVAPWVIAATVDIRTNERTNYWESFRRSSSRIPTILGALVWNYAIVVLMTITIVLIPLAIYRQIQWAYAPHAILIDGAGVRNSRHVSRNTIKGDWLRTLGMAVLVTIVAGIPGPVIGLILILLHAVSLDAAGYISSLIFAITYPITIIATTLYYLWRKEVHAERAAEGLDGSSPGDAFWLRLRHPLTGGRTPAQPTPAEPAMPIPAS